MLRRSSKLKYRRGWISLLLLTQFPHLNLWSVGLVVLKLPFLWRLEVSLAPWIGHFLTTYRLQVAANTGIMTH